jgi:hypothetical protein
MGSHLLPSGRTKKNDLIRLHNVHDALHDLIEHFLSNL